MSSRPVNIELRRAKYTFAKITTSLNDLFDQRALAAAPDFRTRYDLVSFSTGASGAILNEQERARKFRYPR